MTNSLRLGIGALFVFVAAAAALAGPTDPAPAVGMSFTWEGGSWSTSNVMDLPGTQANRNGEGRWVIDGFWSSGDGLYTCDFELEVDPDPFLGATLQFTNNSGLTQPFTANLVLPIAPPIAPSSVISGSTSGSVRDSGEFGGGATLSNSGATPFYTALIDGTAVRTLGNSPFSVSAAQGLTQGFDFGSFVMEPSIAALVNIGIDHAFDLTGGGDEVAFTTTLVVVPEPATMAVLLLGAFAVVRRPR